MALGTYNELAEFAGDLPEPDGSDSPNPSYVLTTGSYANPLWLTSLAWSKITGAPASTGTVTSVSVVTANGVSGTVSNATTTPAIALTLGDITPSSVTGTAFHLNADGSCSFANESFNIFNTGTVSIADGAATINGSTGDIATGGSVTAAAIVLGGDMIGAGAIFLNNGVGARYIDLTTGEAAFASVNGNTITTGTGTLTLSTFTLTATATGNVVVQGGALGTPSSGSGANLTTLNASNISSGTLAAARGGTGVSNTGTITLAGNLVTTGAFNTTFAQAASTTVTLPSTSSAMARTDAGQTFTGAQTFTSDMVISSTGLDHGLCCGSSAGTIAFQASASVLSTAATGPIVTLRGNTYSTNANQRGNMYFVCGNPTTPGASEGAFYVFTGADVQRLKIDKDGVSTFSYGVTCSSTLAVTGVTTLTGALVGTPQALSGPGAINLTTTETAFTSTGVGDALTLANGTNGQIKIITHVSRGSGTGTGVITPTTANGFTTATLTGTGDSVAFVYHTTGGWSVFGSKGTVIA